LTDRHKIWQVMHFDHFDPSHPLNFHILKINDGGGRHLEKLENRHIAATV